MLLFFPSPWHKTLSVLGFFYLWQLRLPPSHSAERWGGLSAGRRSLYMTGPLVGARRSLAPAQSGPEDAASASCPSGGRSSRAYSHTRTLRAGQEHKEAHWTDRDRLSGVFKSKLNVQRRRWEAKDGAAVPVETTELRQGGFSCGTWMLGSCVGLCRSLDLRYKNSRNTLEFK